MKNLSPRPLNPKGFTTNGIASPPPPNPKGFTTNGKVPNHFTQRVEQGANICQVFDFAIVEPCRFEGAYPPSFGSDLNYLGSLISFRELPQLDRGGLISFRELPQLDRGGLISFRELPQPDRGGLISFREPPQLDPSGLISFRELPQPDRGGLISFRELPQLDRGGLISFRGPPQLDPSGLISFRELPQPDRGGLISPRGFTQSPSTLVPPIVVRSAAGSRPYSLFADIPPMNTSRCSANSGVWTSSR